MYISYKFTKLPFCKRSLNEPWNLLSIKLPLYLFFYIGLDVWIWMRGNPFLGLFEGVGPDSFNFFGPKWHSLHWLPFNGPKKVSTFRAHTFKRLSLWISPHPNQYVPPHINNSYINSIIVYIWETRLPSMYEERLLSIRHMCNVCPYMYVSIHSDVRKNYIGRSLVIGCMY